MNELTEIKGRRGGARVGAGRKPDAVRIERMLAARGIRPLTAQMILAEVIDERQTWKRVLTSSDDRIVLEGLKFLVSMRDGKPAQQINVNSTSVSITASEASKARAIVRELMGEPSARVMADPPLLECGGGSLDVRGED